MCLFLLAVNNGETAGGETAGGVGIRQFENHHTVGPRKIECRNGGETLVRFPIRLENLVQDIEYSKESIITKIVFIQWNSLIRFNLFHLVRHRFLASTVSHLSGSSALMQCCHLAGVGIGFIQR